MAVLSNLKWLNDLTRELMWVHTVYEKISNFVS